MGRLRYLGMVLVLLGACGGDSHDPEPREALRLALGNCDEELDTSTWAGQASCQFCEYLSTLEEACDQGLCTCRESALDCVTDPSVLAACADLEPNCYCQWSLQVCAGGAVADSTRQPTCDYE